MEPELVNAYLELLNSEVTNLYKQRLALQAQLTISENHRKELETDKANLLTIVADLEAKLKKKAPKTTNEEA